MYFARVQPDGDEISNVTSPCTKNPCQNGGTCLTMFIMTNTIYKCICPGRWRGRLLLIIIKEIQFETNFKFKVKIVQIFIMRLRVVYVK